MRGRKVGWREGMEKRRCGNAARRDVYGGAARSVPTAILVGEGPVRFWDGEFDRNFGACYDSVRL